MTDESRDELLLNVKYSRQKRLMTQTVMHVS